MTGEARTAIKHAINERRRLLLLDEGDELVANDWPAWKQRDVERLRKRRNYADPEKRARMNLQCRAYRARRRRRLAEASS